MKEYYLFLEKEKKIAELNSIIGKHPYLILKEKTTVKEKILSEKQHFFKNQITSIEQYYYRKLAFFILDLVFFNIEKLLFQQQKKTQKKELGELK